MLFLICILLYFFWQGEKGFMTVYTCDHTPPLRERRSRERAESRHLETRTQAEAMETHMACSSSLAQCAASYPGLSLPAMGWSLLYQLYLSWKCPTDLSTGKYYISVFLTEIHSIDNSTLCPVDKKTNQDILNAINCRALWWVLGGGKHENKMIKVKISKI